MKRTILFSLVVVGLLLATALAYSPVLPTNARAAVRPPMAGVPTVPLFRLYAPSTGVHFYTVDENRKQEALGSGWNLEGIAAQILNQQASGTVPLYVLSEKLRFDHEQGNPVFGYTTSEQEKNQLLQNPFVSDMEGGRLPSGDGGKWQLDGNGIAGYIASTQLYGTVPLYRLYHPPVFGPDESEQTNALHLYPIHFRRLRPSSYDNFYTTSKDEKDKALAQFGYKFFRIEGYVWPQATTVIPHVGPGKPPPDPDTDLLNQGCKRTGDGSYGCSTPSNYEACESYRRNGKVKNCWFSADSKVLDQQAAMDKDLFSVGCKRFLDRPDEFTCKTPKALEACNVYLKKGQVKKCMQAWK